MLHPTVQEYYLIGVDGEKDHNGRISVEIFEKTRFLFLSQ